MNDPITKTVWRWCARCSGILAGVVLTVLGMMRFAFADDSGTLSQTPPQLAWIALHDSRGISIWNYELSIDRGGITAPDRFYWATVTDFSWGIYRSGCALALWFLDWVLSFSWVKLVAAPLLAVEAAFQQVVDKLGLVPTFLTITALLAGLLMLKGRHGTAIWEVVMACLIAALASGAFAHPVQLVAGDNGAVVRAGQLGQEVAAGIATGEAAGKSSEQLRKEQTGQLVDTFVRQPTEMINFGQVIDGTKCENAYTDVVKDGPYGLEDNIRDTMGDCSKPLGQYAANPSASMAIGSLMIMPAAGAVFLMALVLAGSVMAAAVWAMFQAVKAIITLITGLLPGGGRGSLMSTIAEVMVSLVMIVGTSVFLSIFLLVIQAIFAGSGGDQVAKTFVIVDVLILVGTIVFLRWRRQLLAAGQRLAQLMSQPPGGTPSRIPARSGRSLGAVAAGATAGAVRTGIGLAQLRTQRAMASRPAAAGPSFVDGRQQSVIFIGGAAQQTGPGGPTWVQTPTGSAGGTSAASSTGGGRQLLGGGGPADAGTGGGPLPGGPSGSPQLPAGAGGTGNPPLPPGSGDGTGSLRRIESRKQKVAGVLLAAGTQAALATASGGTSAVVAKSAKAATAARSARRAAIVARMAAATASAPQNPPPPAIPMGNNQLPAPSSRPAPSIPAAPAASVIIPGEIVESPQLATPPAPAARRQPPRVTPAPGSSPAKNPSTPAGSTSKSAPRHPPRSTGSRSQPKPAQSDNRPTRKSA